MALLSFLLSNFGLDMIIKMAIPVLCFLYPVMIALALLNVFGFGGNKRVFRCTMWIVTLFAVVEGRYCGRTEGRSHSGSHGKHPCIGSFIQ